ncbi:MAG: PEGA domain-containing protein [Myxococcales bacterium]|nr:PEGA domain-containing protein [Myxococcales bacterium]
MKLIHVLALALLSLAILFPSPATAQTGIPVNIESTPPGAKVFLDAETNPSIGTTPIQAKRIPKGGHTLIFKLDGHRDATLAINVAKWKETFKVDLEPFAVVEISAGNDTATGAAVRLDGKPSGNLPFRAEVEPGRHLVQVGRQGFHTLSQWLDLVPGQKLTLPVMLEAMAPETGSILVAGDVVGAPIYLDGEPHGVTPAVLEDVPAGEHLIEIRPEKMEAHRQTVRVVAGERLSVSPTFRTASTGGNLRIIANIPDAQIFLDGEALGVAPVTRNGVPAGEHVVQARAEGFAMAEEKVVVEAGGQRVISLRLEAIQRDDGRIVVNSSIGHARIRVDNRDLGQPPVVIENPTHGAHAIIVTAEGFKDLRTTCETGPTQSCELVAELEPVEVRLRVTADVRGAELFIDGQARGVVPYENQVPAGPHRIEVRADGYVTHVEQVNLAPSEDGREIEVELEPADAANPKVKAERERANEELLYGLTTHSAASIPVNAAALDISTGWPHIAEARVHVGLLDFLDAGFAYRTFGRLNEFELRSKAGFRLLRQVSVGAQVKAGGGIGPSRDPDPAMETNTESHPVNTWHLSIEGLSTLHFSEHGAFTLWMGVDFHTDRYDWSGTDSDQLAGIRGRARERQDLARYRMGGALELVFSREWNFWASLEGILAGNSRDVLGDVFGFGGEDTELYVRLGSTYKF